MACLKTVIGHYSLRSVAFLLAIVGLIATSISCTPSGRGGSSGLAAISIALPVMSRDRAASTDGSPTARATASFSLSRVMINVTGSSLAAPVVYIWDGSQAGSGSAPSSFNLSVTQGSNYLIQVLAVLTPTGASNSSQMVFTYGDTTADITSATVPIAITLSELTSTAATQAQGAIAGRWLSSSSAGPTGKVNIEFTPPGKPPMIVTQGEIFGGWFQWVAFGNITFSYVFQDGTMLVPNFNLNTTGLVTGQANNALVSVPAHYQNNDGAYVTSSPWLFQVGYFGPGVTTGASGNVLCFDSSSSDSMTQIFSDAAGADPIPWSGATAPSATQAGVVTGGTAAAGANCSAVAGGTKPFTNWMPFLEAQVSGNNNPLPIQGPFYTSPITTTINGSSVMVPGVSPSGTNGLNLYWAYVPGASAGVDSIGVFVRDLPTAPNYTGSPDYQADNGVACNRLTDPAFLTQTFNLAATVPIQNSGSGPQTYALNGYPSADLNAGRLQVILCPYSSANSSYYNSAMVFGQYSSSNNATPVNAVPSPFTLSITPQAANQPQGGCGTYTVTYSSSSGVPTAAVGFVVSTASTTGFVYANATCSGAAATSLSAYIPAGSTSTIVSFSDSSAELTQLALLNSTSGAQQAIEVASYETPGASSQIQIVVEPGSSMVTGLCYPVDLVTVDSSARAIALANANSYTLSSVDTGTTLPFGTYFQDPGCKTAAPPTVQFNSTTAYNRVYFMPTAITTGTANLNVDDVAYVSADPMNSSQIVSVVSPSSSVLSAELNNTSSGIWYPSGGCVAMSVAYITPGGALASAPSPVNVIVTGDGTEQFYTDPTCGTTAQSSVTVPINPAISSVSVASPNIYVRFSTAATSLVNATITGFEPVTTTLYRQPDTLTVSGQEIFSGFCFPMTVVASWTDSHTVPIPMNVKLTVASGSVQLYGDPACSTTVATAVIPATGTAATVYGMAYSNSSVSGQMPATSLSTASPGLVSISPVTPITSPAYFTTAGTSTEIFSFSPDQCVQMYFGQFSIATTLVVNAMTPNLMTPYASYYFYTDNSCTTPMTTGTEYISPAVYSNNVSTSGPTAGYFFKLGATFPATNTPVVFQIGELGTGATFDLEITCNSSTCTSGF